MHSILKTLNFYGWRIVAAGAIIQALHSGLLFSAFGSYSVLLQQEFGWTPTTLSIAYAMSLIHKQHIYYTPYQIYVQPSILYHH